MDHDVGAAEGGWHQFLVAHISLDEVERRVGAQMVKALLAAAVHEVVQGRHLEAGVEQMLADDAAEVAKAAGHENTFWHPASKPCAKVRIGVYLGLALTLDRKSTRLNSSHT